MKSKRKKHGQHVSEKKEVRNNEYLQQSVQEDMIKKDKFTYLFKIDIVAELHVLCVNSENFKASHWVQDTNVDFSIKATKMPQSRIDGVGSVSCHHDYSI